jgi:hypothetical protein
MSVTPSLGLQQNPFQYQSPAVNGSKLERATASPDPTRKVVSDRRNASPEVIDSEIEAVSGSLTAVKLATRRLKR